jgi:hypothetical protein
MAAVAMMAAADRNAGGPARRHRGMRALSFIMASSQTPIADVRRGWLISLHRVFRSRWSYGRRYPVVAGSP